MAGINKNPFKFFLGETVMNKDQVKGTVNDIAGKAQVGAGRLVGNKEQQAKGSQKQAEGKAEEGAGKLVGNKEQQAKGLQKQAEGKAEERFGDVKEVVK